MKRFVKLAALCISMVLLSMSLFTVLTPVQALDNAKTIVGYGSVGEGVGKQSTLIDFADASLGGFVPFAGSEALNIGSSAVWGTNVLKTYLASPGSEMGMKKEFADATALEDAATLSVQMVAQTSAYTVTLRLAGTDKDGTPIVLVATIDATTNQWQTLTFDIDAFTSQMDKNAPVTVTLLASAANESDTGASWMIKSIYVNTPETFPEYILPITAAVCGLVLGFAICLVIYRSTCNKNRRPLWEEEL